MNHPITVRVPCRVKELKHNNLRGLGGLEGDRQRVRPVNEIAAVNFTQAVSLHSARVCRNSIRIDVLEGGDHQVCRRHSRTDDDFECFRWVRHLSQSDVVLVLGLLENHRFAVNDPVVVERRQLLTLDRNQWWLGGWLDQRA